MTTTLRVLEDKLAVAIGDIKQTYANHYANAINNAIREIYPNLHKRLEDKTLITGNILPPFIWNTDGDELDFYTEPTGTLAKTTTAGLFRNGENSASVTASGADDYLYISSNDYPRLLDLMNRDIDYKGWAYPQTADDAFLTIYTVKADGTAQTLNSTTSCPASKFTLLELEDQPINDNIVEIQFRMRVHTSGQYVYFDPPRAIGMNIYEYLLPQDFQDGFVSSVEIQTSGYSDDICDDLQPRSWEKVYNWSIVNDGSYKYLRLPAGYSNGRKIRLIGYCPLETQTADTSTISLDGEKVNLLIAYAAYLLYEMVESVPASGDVSRYERASSKWLSKYYRLLPMMKMATPRMSMNLPNY